MTCPACGNGGTFSTPHTTCRTCLWGRERERQALERAAKVADAHNEAAPGDLPHHTPCFYSAGHECSEDIAAAIRGLIQEGDR